MPHDTLSTPESILKNCIQTLKDAPGVYRFYNTQAALLYVGKAKRLKKRLNSYVREQKSTRTSTLISQIARIEITLTSTENEALLLESNLIKKLQPHYNVLLRDDKSYPYLVLSHHQDFPRLYSYRGKPKHQAECFGPYPNISAMRDALNSLQKLFKLRVCRDTFFKNRVRPCLQYQIQRCTAPCVGLISAEEYQKDVNTVRLLLKGKNSIAIQNLLQQMKIASEQQDYEKAAALLNQVNALRQVQQQQAAITSCNYDIDIISMTSQANLHCIYVLPIREGKILGGQAYFPEAPSFLGESAVLSQFISQFYTRAAVLPEQILIDKSVDEQLWLTRALSAHHHTRLIIRQRPKKLELPWVAFAKENADQALVHELRAQKNQQKQRYALQQALQLPHLPKRLECFDISHTHGEAAVASCVVFDAQGPYKKGYRRFNINNITPGDDYAAMQQALRRRYSGVSGELPEVLIVDGGKGQLAQATSVLTELQLANQIKLIAIAKGPTRKAGNETLFLTKQAELTLKANDPVLHLLQHIRDEAHRFAVSSHRQKRAKTRKSSLLESIRGIGPKKRQRLLTQFGGLQGLKQATPYELRQMPGITAALANILHSRLKQCSSNK